MKFIQRKKTVTRIVVVSTDSVLNESIQKECSASGEDFFPIFLSETSTVIEFLKYELPEVKVFYFSDKNADVCGILDQVQKDPWLHYGGIIAIHDNSDEKGLLETMRNSNVIAVLKKTEFLNSVGRLLRIIGQNKHILFQRGIQQHLLKNISGSFVVDNDPLDITTYTNLVTNYLYNANLINKEIREKLHVALMELLINAIEHGNCKISYEEKTAWLEKNHDIMELIRRKNMIPEIRAKKVYFSYTISPDTSKFVIRDEGAGFNWRARMGTRLELGLHGMGMKMANLYVSSLSYNEQGNEASFELNHQRNESNTIPEIFAKQDEAVFRDGEFIFREGEESDFLYYLVSGKVHVYSKGKLVSVLTPDDIFLGEMSFLLSNKRSATVVSKGKSVLIKISKIDFVNLIKQSPHYGIFLARLLAQRLVRLNYRTAMLNTEYLKLKSRLEQGGA
jgi:anti-sigma regulatory factor (Ser/Thr protein kinase)